MWLDGDYVRGISFSDNAEADGIVPLDAEDVVEDVVGQAFDQSTLAAVHGADQPQNLVRFLSIRSVVLSKPAQLRDRRGAFDSC